MHISSLSLHDALPISWVFERSDDIRLKTLEPVSVDGYGKKDADRLMNDVRQMMIRQLSEWRGVPENEVDGIDRKSTRLNSSHVAISYAVFCLKKKTNK